MSGKVKVSKVNYLSTLNDPQLTCQAVKFRDADFGIFQTKDKAWGQGHFFPFFKTSHSADLTDTPALASHVSSCSSARKRLTSLVPIQAFDIWRCSFTRLRAENLILPATAACSTALTHDPKTWPRLKSVRYNFEETLSTRVIKC